MLAPGCLLCGTRCALDQDLCGPCITALPRTDLACPRCLSPGVTSVTLPCGRCLRREPAFDRVWAPLAYQHPVDRMVQHLKFGGDLSLTTTLARLLSRAPPPKPWPEALIPVPLHVTRLRERGFNQATELARPLAGLFGMPVIQALKRRHATANQSELDARRRAKNLRGAFAVKAGCLPDHVAVVDDVMTTGRTADRCAAALKRSGVEFVDIWVVARA